MSQQTVRHIICAVRSRPGGEETVNQAIELALESEARLTFFQVIDARFMKRVSARGGSIKSLYGELRDMAEFTLTILCNQAKQRGVTEVDYIVRRGNVREQLRQVLAETEADVLVMGRPRSGPGRSAFKTQELDKFIAELERAQNVRVIAQPVAG